MKFNVDTFTSNTVAGWALSPKHASKVSIEVRCGDRVVGRCIANRPRPDVGQAFPDIAGSANSGFLVQYGLPARKEADIVDVTILARADGDHSSAKPIEIARRSIVADEAFARAAAFADSPKNEICGPFPKEIMALIETLWPEQQNKIERDDIQQLMANRLSEIAGSINGLHSVPALADYIRFLRSTWDHFNYVNRYFPASNSNKNVDDKDWSGKLTSPVEMISIAHHLYVLKSYGVTGDFAEFGCFKGFSSSMLSYACSLLGVRMHIFDSFAGLPASESGLYQAGEFRGSLREVENNIRYYGVRGSVSMHPGYFHDSLKAFEVPKLMALWMDVDLESSAADVMTIAHKIDPRGAIFSHECGPRKFEAGTVVPRPRHAENVVPPLVDFFDSFNESVTGCFVVGITGAFWRKASGVPVLSNAALMKFISAV
jgi:O-methyltransferase